jgi:starvation-inducible DNA-binding protein
MAKLSIKPTAKKAPNVADALQNVLSDTYTLFLVTHNYHWNVEGQNFVSLHTLFEQQYNEQFAAVDEIAERIRALDAYALPTQYGEILTQVSKFNAPAGKDKSKQSVAEKMIANLVVLHERVVKSAQIAKELADDMDDEESEDLTIARIQTHQKALWMLKSLLK